MNPFIYFGMTYRIEDLSITRPVLIEKDVIVYPCLKWNSNP